MTIHRGQVAGRHEQMTWLRKDGTFPKLTRDHIMESVHGSLERMGTDYIDVLSFGDWPERSVLFLNVLYFVWFLMCCVGGDSDVVFGGRDSGGETIAS